MTTVEHLLNLFWLLLSAALFAHAARAHGRSQLRCSLPLAFGCTALLALLLFPALSMTDDLQRSRLDVEQTARHIGNTLLLGTLNEVQLGTAALGTALLFLLLSLAARKNAGMFVQRLAKQCGHRYDGSRPDAVRPPPAGCLS